jgi:polyferredoxin
MSAYPTAASVPPPVWHRMLLAMWGLLSLLVVGLYGWQAIAEPDKAGGSLAMIGIGLLYASAFGMAGLFVRRRYLIRKAAREAFLARLDTDRAE